jgi:hypothetical protein
MAVSDPCGGNTEVAEDVLRAGAGAAGGAHPGQLAVDEVGVKVEEAEGLEVARGRLGYEGAQRLARDRAAAEAGHHGRDMRQRPPGQSQPQVGGHDAAGSRGQRPLEYDELIVSGRERVADGLGRERPVGGDAQRADGKAPGAQFVDRVLDGA